MAKLVIKGKNIDVTPALKDYIGKKLSRLDKYAHHIVEIVVEMHVEKNPRISDNNIIDVNIYANGAVLRAEEANTDMDASIDLVLDKLDRQMKKYEEKRVKNKTGKLKLTETMADNDSYEEDKSDDEVYSTY